MKPRAEDTVNISMLWSMEWLMWMETSIAKNKDFCGKAEPRMRSTTLSRLPVCIHRCCWTFPGGRSRDLTEKTCFQKAWSEFSLVSPFRMSRFLYDLRMSWGTTSIARPCRCQTDNLHLNLWTTANAIFELWFDPLPLRALLTDVS